MTDGSCRPDTDSWMAGLPREQDKLQQLLGSDPPSWRGRGDKLQQKIRRGVELHALCQQQVAEAKLRDQLLEASASGWATRTEHCGGLGGLPASVLCLTALRFLDGLSLGRMAASCCKPGVVCRADELWHAMCTDSTQLTCEDNVELVSPYDVWKIISEVRAPKGLRKWTTLYFGCYAACAHMFEDY